MRPTYVIFFVLQSIVEYSVLPKNKRDFRYSHGNSRPINPIETERWGSVNSVGCV
jgi:hypothetical protein